MGNLVFILGKSGTGKSHSLRNFKPDEIGIVNVQGKILPFKGSGAYDTVNTDDSGKIVRAIKKFAEKYKIIIVDDFQYVMANEFMRRATERGYDKFTEIARHAWDIATVVNELPLDVNVYIMCHTDTDQDGFEKLKTIGRFLDEKIVLEGMSSIVLKTAVSDGQYMFLTQNNGKDTVKSPSGMFPTYAIDNDLKYVDDKIRSYYEIGSFKSEKEMKKEDEAVSKPEIQKEEKKKRGRKAQTEGIEDTSAEEKKEKVKRTRRKVSDDLSEERQKVQEENEAAVATNSGNGTIEEDADEELPFSMNDPDPEIQDIPKRKKCNKKESVEESVEAAETPQEEKKPRRRRRLS